MKRNQNQHRQFSTHYNNGQSMSSPPFENSNHGKARVIKKNLVYVIGLPQEIASEEILKKEEYFGQYGQITNFSLKVNSNNAGQYQDQDSSHHNHQLYSAFITYATEMAASIAILACGEAAVSGKTIKASYGMTKFCPRYKFQGECPQANCPYYHSLAEESHIFEKQDSSTDTNSYADQMQIALKILSKYTPNILKIMQSGKVKSQIVLPQPETIFQNLLDKGLLNLPQLTKKNVEIKGEKNKKEDNLPLIDQWDQDLSKAQNKPSKQQQLSSQQQSSQRISQNSHILQDNNIDGDNSSNLIKGTLDEEAQGDQEQDQNEMLTPITSPPKLQTSHSEMLPENDNNNNQFETFKPRERVSSLTSTSTIHDTNGNESSYSSNKVSNNTENINKSPWIPQNQIKSSSTSTDTSNLTILSTQKKQPQQILPTESTSQSRTTSSTNLGNNYKSNRSQHNGSQSSNQPYLKNREPMYIPLKQQQLIQQQQEQQQQQQVQKQQKQATNLDEQTPAQNNPDKDISINANKNLNPQYLHQKVSVIKREEPMETCIMKRLVGLRKKERLECFIFNKQNLNNENNKDKEVINKIDKDQRTEKEQDNDYYYVICDNLIDGSYLELTKQVKSSVSQSSSQVTYATISF